jgi:hypothetical protein
VARGDPVDGIGIVRYLDSVSGQLVTKAYRPRTSDQRGFLQPGDLGRQLLGPIDGRFPEPGAVGGVERGKNLAPPAVENGEGLPVPFWRYSPRRNRRMIGLSDATRQGVERADAPRRQTEADAEPAGGGDPHPQAGEGAGTEPDGDQVDLTPAARRGGGALDLLQQPGRVQRPPLRGETQLRLVKNLAVAPGAGDGVDRRGVEADDVQRAAIP